MIPKIENFDYFHEWRSKTNLIATLIGDLELVEVAAADRDSFVEAINKVISNIGLLSSLTTTVKSTIVGAIDELDGEHGDLTTLATTAKNTFVAAINELDNEMGALNTLKTTSQSSVVHAINEVFDSLLIGNATFTVGSEAGDVIRVTEQLKDRSGDNLAISTGVFAYLSDNSNGLSLIGTAHSGGWAIGTTGVLIPVDANKAAHFICSSSGVFNIDITETGTKTAYLVVVLPLGNLKISTAITHA